MTVMTSCLSLFMFKLWVFFVDGGVGDMKHCMRKTIHELFMIKSVLVTWFLRSEYLRRLLLLWFSPLSTCSEM